MVSATRLAVLLEATEDELIERLGHRIIPAAHETPVELWRHAIAQTLTQTELVRQLVVGCRPPAFALLCELVWEPSHQTPYVVVRRRALETTKRLCEMVATGEILGRHNQCRIYRRVLRGAWANDLKLDPAEMLLLKILRDELKMTQVEHYLLSHHPEVRPYWELSSKAFDEVTEELVEKGVLFVRDHTIFLPKEFVPKVREALGIYLSRDGARRLFSRLSNADLREALAEFDMRLSGSKDERIMRLMDHLAPAKEVLGVVNILELQKIAKKVGAKPYGAKAELIDRLVEFFHERLDIAHSEVDASLDEPEREPRALSSPQFEFLFGKLRSHELKALCIKQGLKRSGGKAELMEHLRSSPLAAPSTLRLLRNADLRASLVAMSLGDMGQRTRR